MNTNEPKSTIPESADNWASLLSEHKTPVGLPDPTVLARMANEFLTALPAAAPHAGPVPDPAQAPVPLAQAGRIPLPLAGQSASPAGSAQVLTPNSITPVPQTAPPAPAIPSGFHGGRSPAVPGFGFLQDARPLFVDAAGYRPTERSTPALKISDPTAKPLQEFVPARPGYSAIPHFLDDDALHALSREGFQPPTPAIPASLGTVDSSAAPTFSFMEDARALFALDVSEVPRSRTGELPDLKLDQGAFDVEAIRRDFPILRERVNGRPLVWLDNAATTQKPQCVLDRLNYFYEHENSNVHRAAHELAARSTDAYESAREKVRRFLNAPAVREIIFVRGATEGINLVAQSWGRRHIQENDEIVITWLEHHANIVPWQMLCSEKRARLRVAPVDDRGQVILEEYEKLLGPKTRLVALPQISNALGSVTPARAMIEAAHRHGALVLLDGAQAVSHMHVDVQALDCDFYVFSGHKVFAPTGIGVIYGKSAVLDVTPPWQGGGNMIADVTFEKTAYQAPPQRFEAGTGNIADAVGLGAAIDYLDRIGMVNISRHEHELLNHATAGLERIPGLHIIGKAKEKAGVISLILDGFRVEEIGDFLNRRGIAVRAGHHCAQPIHRRFGLESTLRASLALYNNFEDIDALIAAIWDLKQGRSPGLE